MTYTTMANRTDICFFRSNQGNETAFMNGVNEVQSSSMVQQRTGLTSSPIAAYSPMEQFDTIMEDNNGEQASGVTTTTLTVPQIIPHRVLTELSVTISNTPTPINVNKQPIENSLRATDTTNDEVGEFGFLLTANSIS